MDRALTVEQKGVSTYIAVYIRRSTGIMRFEACRRSWNKSKLVKFWREFWLSRYSSKTATTNVRTSSGQCNQRVTKKYLTVATSFPRIHHFEEIVENYNKFRHKGQRWASLKGRAKSAVVEKPETNKLRERSHLGRHISEEVGLLISKRSTHRVQYQTLWVVIRAPPKVSGYRSLASGKQQSRMPLNVTSGTTSTSL